MSSRASKQRDSRLYRVADHPCSVCGTPRPGKALRGTVCKGCQRRAGTRARRLSPWERAQAADSPTKGRC